MYINFKGKTILFSWIQFFTITPPNSPSINYMLAVYISKSPYYQISPIWKVIKSYCLASKEKELNIGPVPMVGLDNNVPILIRGNFGKKCYKHSIALRIVPLFALPYDFEDGPLAPRFYIVISTHLSRKKFINKNIKILLNGLHLRQNANSFRSSHLQTANA